MSALRLVAGTTHDPCSWFLLLRHLIIIKGRQVELVVLALAVFRITRLLVVDSIAEPVRNFFGRWAFTDEMLACPWCTSFWVAVPAAVMFWQWPDVTYWLSLPFALSAVAGLLSRD